MNAFRQNCGSCDASPATTCNGEFSIQLLSTAENGSRITFNYEVCKLGRLPGPFDFPRWILALDQFIPYLAPGKRLSDLVVSATMDVAHNRAERTGFVVHDPTTQVSGIGFFILALPWQRSHEFHLTLDSANLIPGVEIVPSCVLAATGLGHEDINPPPRRLQKNFPVPGYVCVEGPTPMIPPLNLPPVTSNLTFQTSEDVPVSVVLQGSDPEGGPVSFTIESAPTNGTLSGTAPNLLYTPNPNFNGMDVFVVDVSDAQGAIAKSVVTINVAPVPDAPIATLTGPVTGPEDAPLLIQLAGLDPDAGSVTSWLTRIPNRGVLYQVLDDNQTRGALISSRCPPTGQPTIVSVQVSNKMGWVLFMPCSNENGKPYTSMRYYVADSSDVRSAELDFNINISNVNDPPGANNREEAFFAGNVNGDQLTLDCFDPDGDTLTGIITSFPTRGHLFRAGNLTDLVTLANPTFNPAQLWFVTDNPGPAEFGTNYATFTYYVQDPGGLISNSATNTINILKVNQPPQATGTFSVTTDEDTPIEIILTSINPEGEPVIYFLTEGPKHGKLALAKIPNSDIQGYPVQVPVQAESADGLHLIYTPDPNFNTASGVPDSFSFQVADCITPEGAPLGTPCDINMNPTNYTTEITVTSVNDRPVITGPSAVSNFANAVITITNIVVQDDSGDGLLSVSITGDPSLLSGLTLLDTTGLINYLNSGNTLSFSATLANIDAALASGLQFQIGTQSGLNAVVIQVADNGNSGVNFVNLTRSFLIRVDVIPGIPTPGN